jgi:hypothetical protein
VTSSLNNSFLVGLGLRQSDEFLALINSIMETTATLLLVVIRMANAYSGYRMVRNTIRHEVNFDPDEDLHIRLIRRWMWLYIAAGVTLFSISLGFFFIFLFQVHLGWTILTNNFCMITIMTLTSLYMGRITLTMVTIREDQHKVENTCNPLKNNNHITFLTLLPFH